MKQSHCYHLLVGQNFLRQIASPNVSSVHEVLDAPFAFCPNFPNVNNQSQRPTTSAISNENNLPPVELEQQESNESRTKIVTFHEESIITVHQSLVEINVLAQSQTEAAVTSYQMNEDDVMLSTSPVNNNSSSISRKISARIKNHLLRPPESTSTAARERRRSWFTAKNEKDQSWYARFRRRSSKTTHSLGGGSTVGGKDLSTGEDDSERCSVAPDDASSVSNMSVSRVERFTAHLKKMSFLNVSEKWCYLNARSHAPMLLTTVVPYRTPSQTRSTNRVRHTSSTSSEAFGIRPIELDEEEELSYRHLLLPMRLERSLANYRVSPAPRSLPPSSSKKSRLEDGVLFNQSLPTQSGAGVAALGAYSRCSSVEPRGGSCHDGDSVCSSELDLLMRSANTHDWHATTRQQSTIVPPTVYEYSTLNSERFGAAHHKTTLRFPYYITTILDYVERDELKKEANEKFKQQFQHIQLSYSKLNSIKREMREIVQSLDWDLLIVAYAYVYFEKLVIKAQISKSNRKCLAGACVLLAAKFNDTRSTDLEQLIESIEATFRISRKDLLALELPTLVALEFSLHLPEYELYEHHHQLLAALT